MDLTKHTLLLLTHTHTFSLMKEINKTTVWRNLEPMRTGTGLLVGERGPHTTLSYTLTHTLPGIPVEKRL